MTWLFFTKHCVWFAVDTKQVAATNYLAHWHHIGQYQVGQSRTQLGLKNIGFYSVVEQARHA